MVASKDDTTTTTTRSIFTQLINLADTTSQKQELIKLESKRVQYQARYAERKCKHDTVNTSR